jgi:hypothetical protein
MFRVSNLCWVNHTKPFTKFDGDEHPKYIFLSNTSFRDLCWDQTPSSALHQTSVSLLSLIFYEVKKKHIMYCVLNSVKEYFIYFICITVLMAIKTIDSIRRELQTECVLDKIDEYRTNWLLHLQRMPQNRIPLTKIIPLQSTRKENNWETEETLTWAAVTLETERSKWPNPWFLWLWWWWCICRTRLIRIVAWKFVFIV